MSHRSPRNLEIKEEVKVETPDHHFQPVVTVKSQVSVIRIVAFGEIAIGIIALLGQTVAIASSYDFATRSLTGIWTSWFFLMSAAVCLFWSTRCTFNGLQAVLVLQIISATMGVPLFTASCVLFGVYPFKWSLDADGEGGALIYSSIVMLVTNLILMLCSIAELLLNGYNAFNCYILAYGENKQDSLSRSGNNYRTQSGQNAARAHETQQFTQDHEGADDWNHRPMATNYVNTMQDESYDWDNTEADNKLEETQDAVIHQASDHGRCNRNENLQQSAGQGSNLPLNCNSNRRVKLTLPKSAKVVLYDDPSMPQPPPDLTISEADILVIKYCGITGVFLAFLIFCCQATLLALASEIGVNIGVGIWGAAYYTATGIVTVYNGLKPSPQSSVSIFILQTIQFVLSVPLVGISYYIMATFGSCVQHQPVSACPKDDMSAGITLTCLGGVMALSGTIQAFMSLILMLICSQPVCGIRCLISGGTVYPIL